MKLLLDKCPNCQCDFVKAGNGYYCQSSLDCYQIVQPLTNMFFYYNMIYYNKDIDGSTTYDQQNNVISYYNKITEQIYLLNDIHEVDKIRNKILKYKSFA